MKKDMKLPSGSKKMTLEEMMQNESGWYANLRTGELFVTYKDIDKAVNFALSFLEKLNVKANKDDVAGNIEKNTPLGKMGGGFGIRYDEKGFAFFQLSEEQLKLANTNTFVF